MRQETGGPAFPVPVRDGNEYGRDFIGLTVRDWFAGQAMILAGVAGAIATANDEDAKDAKYSPSDLAARAYELADAMLAERNKE